MYMIKKKIKIVSLREIVIVVVNFKCLKNEDFIFLGDYNLELVYYFVDV